MKHKVGDTVTIRKDLVELVGVTGYDVVTGMVKYAGQTIKIISINDPLEEYKLANNNWGWRDNILEGNKMGYDWTDEMFEGYVEEKEEDVEPTPSASETVVELFDLRAAHLERTKEVYRICLEEELQRIGEGWEVIIAAALKKEKNNENNNIR